jgi:hypothetical protein
MSQYNELVTILKELLFNRFYPKPEYIRGLLGDGRGNVLVPDRPDYNYVRFSRSSTETFEVFNKEVSQPVDGWPVLIGSFPWAPGLVQVVATDWSAYAQTGWGDSVASIQAHAPTHEWPNFTPGSDAINTYLRAITPMRAQAAGSGSTSVLVTAYEYDGITGTNYQWPGLPPYSLQPATPPSGTMRYMGIYLNPMTNTLGVVTGSTTIYTDAAEPSRPAWPRGVFPSAYVRLYGGQAAITERDIRDARRLWQDTNIYTGTSTAASQAEVNAGADQAKYVTPAALANTPRALPRDGRLTLTSGTPVLTSNVTGATTIYFTPHLGNRMAVYTGVFWKILTFGEISVAVPATLYRLFDIFCYESAGALALETLNWSQSTAAITGATNASPIVITSNAHGLSNNDLVAVTGVGGNTAANGIWSVANVAANTFELEGSTGSGAFTSGGTWYKLNATRATALTTQNGIYVKSGDATRRYLGTGMTGGTSGQTEMQFDSPSSLLLWNYYNRVFGRFTVQDLTSHTYTSATARIYRNQNSNKVAFVIGVFEENPAAAVLTGFNFDSGDGAVTAGAGINRTGAVQFEGRVADAFDARYLNDFGLMVPNTGYNFLQLTQTGAATSPDFQRAIIRGQFFL